MSEPVNVSNLFQSALDSGDLSQQAANILCAPDLGAVIQAGLGGSLAAFEHSEALLMALLIDDSGSIRFAGNSQVMVEGHNLIIDALEGSKQKDNVFLHTLYLNGFVLNPYVLLGQAVRMSSKNYNPNQGTPLYDQSVALLGTVLAEFQRYADLGVQARTITYIVSDGKDEHSVKYGPDDVAIIVRDLQSEKHIIGAMGIDDGRTDFHKVFGEMGIRDELILTPKNTASEIRKAFMTASQSAVRASQSAAGFSQTAAGGFGN